jgi:hypothetical protein
MNGVGGHDEERGQHGADRHEPDAGGVQPGGQLVPSEDPQSQERRFQEEREQRLHGQRRPENVTDEAGVIRPVHPELELLGDSGDHPDREVDQEDLAPELRRPKVDRLAGVHPRCLHDRDEERHPDGDRDEQEVVDGGDTELPPGDPQRIHRRLLQACNERLRAGSPQRRQRGDRPVSPRL